MFALTIQSFWLYKTIGMVNFDKVSTPALKSYSSDRKINIKNCNVEIN
jgi:hypothetical protein